MPDENRLPTIEETERQQEDLARRLYEILRARYAEQAIEILNERVTADLSRFDDPHDLHAG